MLWRSCLLGVIAAVIVLRAGAAPAETIRRPTTGFGIQSVATVFDGPTTVYPNAVAVAPDRSVVVAASRGDFLQGQISQQADADLAQTLVHLTQTQNAYQVALQSGAKLLSNSLLDYLH